MKHKLTTYSLLISIIVSFFVFVFYWYHSFINFENKSLDWRFKIRGPQETTSPVIIAAIDAESLDVIGKWPWRRKVHARLVDRLRRAGVSAIVFDVLFYEPDRDRPEDDRALVRAVRRSKNTVSAFSFDYLEEEFTEIDEEGNTILVKDEVISKGEPLPSLARHSKAAGFVNCFPDPDGYLRRAPLFYQFEEEWYQALNIQAVAIAQGKTADEIVSRIPVSEVISSWGYPSKEVLINYRGPVEGSFATYSCASILDGTVPSEWLEGKIVLIGSTALGLYDHYPTPFQSSFPGLYFHANVIDNIWAGDFLVPAGAFLTILLIFAFGISGGIVIPRVSAAMGALMIFALAGGFWVIGYLLMVKKLYYIELVAPTVAMISSYASVFFYRFIVEQKEKAGIKKAFGVYVNPHVVDQISKNPDGLKLGGEMREMTVMFSDVAGFTSISENLSPKELVHLLNLYLTAMTDTIMRHDGTVDKYEGDAIMAFWGAPLIQPDHGKQACLTVLENRERLRELNQELEKQGVQKLSARCGLNTGPMNVGNMGSTQKFNYTVMGDSVNLASRLEGANKQYGTNLMISESTFEHSKDEIEARELDLLRVKGKNVPIKVFELLCKKGELTDSQKKGLEIYNQGLVLYRKRDFKKSVAKFQKVMDHLPDDPPSETYLKRAKNYIESPPPKNWDGVFVMTTK